MLKTALIFQNHMTLQRDKEIPVWGTADPGASVSVSLQGKTADTAADSEGKWKVFCGPFDTSFREEMTIVSGSDKLILGDIQVGEVWLAGGQSNMEFHMRYDAGMAEEKKICQNDNIRFFDYPEVSESDPAEFQPVMGPKYERRPCGLYESMLKQVAPYGIRGVIWYQGETDRDCHPEVYKTLLPAMIRSWRALWKEEFPFLFVQIAPLERWMDCCGKNYVEIRKAQQHAAETIPDTGMAVITDVGMQFDIHPKKRNSGRSADIPERTGT